MSGLAPHAPPRWTARLPLGIAAITLVGTFIACEWGVGNAGSWPCVPPPVWDTDTPFHLSLSAGSVPIGSDAFLRGMSLVDENGTTLPLVAAEGDFGHIVVCARDGLYSNTLYTWTIGPWDQPASNEVGFEHDALETVTFSTGAAPGQAAPDAAACAALAAAHPLSDYIFSRCDPNPPTGGDSGESAGVDGS